MPKRNRVVFILILISSNIFGQKIIRGPYLQQVTSNSIIVRWRTDLESQTKILYGSDKNNLNLSDSIDNLNPDHLLKLNNLKPDTRYYYQIVGLKNQNIDNQYFQTAPTLDSKKPIHIWAGGDFGDLSNEVYKTNQTQVRDAYLNYSKNFDTNLWFWLGDVGYGGKRDATLQNTIFDFYGEKVLPKIPFSAVLGNHEFDEDPVNQQKSRNVNLLQITSPPTNAEGGGVASLTKAYYSFNYGNTHIIALDSYGMDLGVYRLYDTASPQYKWLIQDLDANKSLWTMIMFHHPPYTKRAHDSDVEEELRLLRQTLVPVFDKYKVDLVLNGHSHIYERSYLIQGHYGQSETFDPAQHIVNKNSGKYLANEAPIINKTNGTMYVVAGTFGRLEPILGIRSDNPPHPTSYYSNLTTGGSLAIKIEDNRLDCEWVCADGLVRDRFTLFKNVNKITGLNLNYGDKIKLKASWPGNFKWSNGQLNTQEIEVEPLITTGYSVKDSLGFLQDFFEVQVSPQPIIETKLSNNEVICNGKELNGNFEIFNTDLSKWKYTLQLSDEKGSFSNPKFSQEIFDKDFKILVPDYIPVSNLYQLRVVPNSNLFNIKNSNNFEIKQPSTGKFENEPILPFGEEILLKLVFSGSMPIDYKLNIQPIATTTTENVSVKVKQFEAKNYILESVSNVCGTGKINNGKVNVTAPLSTEMESFGLKLYPNPTDDFLIVEITKGQNKVVEIKDLKGKIIIKQNIQYGKNTISLKAIAAGLYVFEVKENGKSFLQKIIKQ